VAAFKHGLAVESIKQLAKTVMSNFRPVLFVMESMKLFHDDVKVQWPLRRINRYGIAGLGFDIDKARARAPAWSPWNFINAMA